MLLIPVSVVEGKQGRLKEGVKAWWGFRCGGECSVSVTLRKKAQNFFGHSSCLFGTAVGAVQRTVGDFKRDIFAFVQVFGSLKFIAFTVG